ncbi:uncharacterized protein lgals3a isoform X2 [Anguilla anguilla]|uniref:uncharacterized protein lgals3a isoform X2 n=1 Tax=Anguilla anguilla TaxID=7936 RepID=UPI0015ACEA69|nr:uncharacterized protein lgals3a isoform X2 [Anguilla anguilla]XP_035263514.1 uncharacterized protein lgals3a isoform X2 [Anguilla anguilla]
MSLAKLPKLGTPTLLLLPLTPAGLEQPLELLAFPLPPVQPSLLVQGHLALTPEVLLVLDSSHQALGHLGNILVHLLLLGGFLLLRESLGPFPQGREPLGSFQEDLEHRDSFQGDLEPQGSFQGDLEPPGSFQGDLEPPGSFQGDLEPPGSFQGDLEALVSFPLHQDRILLEEVPPNPSHLESLDSFPLVPMLHQDSTLTCHTLGDSLPQAPMDQELPVPFLLPQTPAAIQGSPVEATPQSPLVAGGHPPVAPSPVSPASQAPSA